MTWSQNKEYTMPRVANEIVERRPEEIMAACKKLYRKKKLREISIKDISAETSLSRPAIYNYFDTKEEIFLAILSEEYSLWNQALEKILEAQGLLDLPSFAHALASTLGERELLLKILCMNLYEIEENSSLERLTDFKKQYGRSIDLITACLERFFPSLSEDERLSFILEFYPFMYGLYPYAHPTEKQRTAMKNAGVKTPVFSLCDVAERCILNLLYIERRLP